jgi:cytochrome b subunit of formate dehydrogenase
MDPRPSGVRPASPNSLRSPFFRSARLLGALGFALLLGAVAALFPAGVLANDDCFDCHDDPDLETTRSGQTFPLYVDPEVFGASVHADLECVDCHQDVDPDDLPHEELLEPVYCGDCHDDVQLDFDASSHGQALNRDALYAPRCGDCHGKHDILPATDPKSHAYKMNVPYMCGACHREGAPVARVYDLYEHNIIDNYSLSIHGEGLFKKGLTVTATCTDCHESHKILPHTNPEASISPRRIAETCMKCHARIEDVHDKIIRGELWEKEPGAIPACTDCHLPHKVRKETIAVTMSDRDCLKCHATPEEGGAAGTAYGDAPPVPSGGHGEGPAEGVVIPAVSEHELRLSAHENIPCVKCHADVDPRLDRPCETSGLVDCSNCHAKISEEYAASGHGVARANGIEQAPYCTTCHGDHGVLPHDRDGSPTFRAAVPALCGDCHRHDGTAGQVAELSQDDALTDYSSSVHGRGLEKKGLLPSAICIDCHGSHEVLKHTDPRSTVNPKNLPATCASCHRGIYKDFIKSVHFQPEGKRTKEDLPTCADCHSSHTIGEVEKDAFLTEVTDHCGSCHKELAETYLDTMHGKAYELGYLDAAKCSDCHGAHAILSGDDPNSSVGFRNIVETCRKCHEDANERFTGYLTHATHHDPDKYPILYWTYRGMTTLLIGVFTFFGIHTLLWLPRSFRAMRERARNRRREAKTGGIHYIRRFNTAQRVTHLFVIVSFLSLALTGMMLKFSSMAWATVLANILGGVKNAGVIHRIAAVMTFGYFIYHLTQLVKLKRKQRIPLLTFLFGKDSLMFDKSDIKDFIGSIKWFFGAGPRPDYGRWTYWEKFDYLAVFWGVAIIGASGLMLWFPEFFTRFVPGMLINVATIIHSDEALLAVGFIFTIHFFNTHLRPEAFPMDMVVFTGLAPVEEYKHERPREYAELKRSGELRKRVVRGTISKRRERLIRAFGFTALGLGIILIGLIIYSVLFGYH